MEVWVLRNHKKIGEKEENNSNKKFGTLKKFIWLSLKYSPAVISLKDLIMQFPEVGHLSHSHTKPLDLNRSVFLTL